MELILQNGLEHQQIPVDSICDVFSNIAIPSPKQYYCNPEIPSVQTINENIKRIQQKNQLDVSLCKKAPNTNFLNLDIKMETGTGKTYVYTHAIYELHKRYGFNKFVIVVPSLPIKAGTGSFISDPYVQRHFKDTCGYGSSIDLYVLRAMKNKKRGRQFFPSAVRAFIEGSCQNRNKIYVLLINSALLTNAKQLGRDYDYSVCGFYRPFDAIRSTKPFVIIDEPHKFSKDQKAYLKILEEIGPQCIIRFGATFPTTTVGRGKQKQTVIDYDHLLYNLNACEAFNKNLIKGVAKEHFGTANSKEEKIKISSIENKTSVTFIYQTLSGNKSYTLTPGDSMSIMSNDLEGLSVAEISDGKIVLSNGQEKKKGEEFEVNVYSESYQEQMLRLAIQRHFETERTNFERPNKIKTLALFFIDDIQSFRGDKNGDNAWLRDTFDRLLKSRIEKVLSDKSISREYRLYLEASLNDIAACRAGYFAQDNEDTDEAIAAEVNDILHNKKELLSFVRADGTPNTRRFLFSKWTLKEGWDNPNVFTIAKLRSSGSEISKLQEVGRGLRLPVDENGNRISNEHFMLNYIVDFTEADFANKLVQEINSETPKAIISVLSFDEIERVAKLRNVDSFDLMRELHDKKFITDIRSTLDVHRINEFLEAYPEFDSFGVSKSKIVDRNKQTTNTIKVRKVRFDELRKLWSVLNQKYIMFFDREIDKIIEKDFPLILEHDVFSYHTARSERDVIGADGSEAFIVSDSGVEYAIRGRHIPYYEFLIRANKATSVPISIIHSSICQYFKKHRYDKDYINETSLTNLVQAFEDWKCQKLQSRFKYKQAHYNCKSTALTNEDGSVKSEIVQGSIGIHLEAGKASEKYLYDAIAYDSDLERTNIKSDIDQVVVYGKIPRRSISIPTIANSSYSPDFMYLVKKKNGEKELNLVVETKGVENKTDLRGNEKLKIDCAKSFFNQLNKDNPNIDVCYETQITNESMITLIKKLLLK